MRIFCTRWFNCFLIRKYINKSAMELSEPGINDLTKKNPKNKIYYLTLHICSTHISLLLKFGRMLYPWSFLKGFICLETNRLIRSWLVSTSERRETIHIFLTWNGLRFIAELLWSMDDKRKCIYIPSACF